MTVNHGFILSSPEAFASTAERLLAAGDDLVARRKAFGDQQALWREVLAAIAASGDTLPSALRDDLLRLAALVLEDLEEVEPDLALHVTVNRAMRDGLGEG